MREKDHYIFPAIMFNDNDFIGVEFPDLPGCLTFGENVDEALRMAKDALGGHLLTMEDIKRPIPQPTPFDKVKFKKGQTIMLVDVYLSLLREDEKNKAVRKTVTLPNWLNIAAMNAKINFSNVLQEALKSRLGL